MCGRVFDPLGPTEGREVLCGAGALAREVF
jgi:hypothetical protein